MTLLVAALAFAPGVAWSFGPVLLVLALGAWRWPHRAWRAAGIGLLLVGGLRGVWGQPLALACLLGLMAVVRARAQAWRAEVPDMDALVPSRMVERTRVVADALAHDRTSLAASPIGMLAVLSAGTAMLVLPQVLDDVPVDGVVGTVTRALLAACGAIAIAELVPASSAPVRSLLVGGVVPLARLAAMFRLGGEALVTEAEGLGAVPMVYASLAQRADPALLSALVHAAPERDEAALALGWDAALAAGWKPRLARGVEVPVARALDERGRRAEAFSVLQGAPRLGEVDWNLALLERLDGRTVLWGGGRVPGPILPSGFELDRVLAGDGTAVVDFTALARCRAPFVELAPEGRGMVEVALAVDAAEPSDVIVESVTRAGLGEVLEPGPHRLLARIRTDNAIQARVRMVRVRCEG